MGDTVKIKMLRQLAVSVVLFSSVLAQDSHYCNDGWELYTTEWDGEEHHSCFWFGQNNEKVTHDVAKLICEGMGGFMAEIPYGPHLNYWIVENFWRKINLLPKLIVKLGLQHLTMIFSTGWVPLIYLTITYIILETGYGNTETLQFNGLIGLMGNLTTSIMERTV